MRKRFQTEQEAGFSDQEILEMLLYHSIPREDTANLARRLLMQFGTVRGVLEATAEELTGVDGVGESTAQLLRLTSEVCRRYMASRIAPRLRLNTTEAIGSFILPVFIGKKKEAVYMLCMDEQRTPVFGRVMNIGESGQVTVDIPRLTHEALQAGAKYVVLAHNHPSGFAIPSDSDLFATRDLQRALNAVGIRLLDHLIIGDPTSPDRPEGDYISLSDSHLL